MFVLYSSGGLNDTHYIDIRDGNHSIPYYAPDTYAEFLGGATTGITDSYMIVRELFPWGSYDDEVARERAEHADYARHYC